VDRRSAGRLEGQLRRGYARAWNRAGDRRRGGRRLQLWKRGLQEPRHGSMVEHGTRGDPHRRRLGRCVGGRGSRGGARPGLRPASPGVLAGRRIGGQILWLQVRSEFSTFVSMFRRGQRSWIRDQAIYFPGTRK
jgi:hypothetical protein